MAAWTSYPSRLWQSFLKGRGMNSIEFAASTPLFLGKIAGMETLKTAAMMISAPGTQDRTVELGEGLTIGRAPTNQLVVEDPKISRHHAEIRRTASGRLLLTDLGSSNGTWVNERRLTTPCALENGDIIAIGSAHLQFMAPPAATAAETTTTTGTSVMLQTEQVIVLVADIRNYTSMSESLQSESFSRFISDWFRECSEVIEAHGGTIDKFIGDAVLAYWTARDLPAKEVNQALMTALDLVARAERFSKRLQERHPGQQFRIGIGLNLGEAIFGNIGTSKVQSFTIVGDCVNVAFRLEALTKEKGYEIIVGEAMVKYADSKFRVQDLGLALVKGRKEPVHIYHLFLHRHDEAPISALRRQ